MTAFKRRCAERWMLHKSATNAPRRVLPRLPYECLFPEMLPFPHPTNLLLMPIHVLGHQDLRARHMWEAGRDNQCIWIQYHPHWDSDVSCYPRHYTVPLLWGWCRMCFLLLLLELSHLCPGTSPKEGKTNRVSRDIVHQVSFQASEI